MTTDPKRHLVLLGAGHAHLHVLARLARLSRARRARIRATLVSPYPMQVYPAMLPGFVAGHYTLAQCTIALERLVAASGVQFIQGRAAHVHADQHTVELVSHGQTCTLPYDVLGINTGAVMDRQRLEEQMPGAREHAVFVRPLEAFAAQWERLHALAQSQPLALVVVGGGATGAELALAIRHRLPAVSLKLVSGALPPVADHAHGMQRRVTRALRARQIAVVPQRCVGMAADHLLLDDGTTLPCNGALLAVGVHAPPWLARSGLTLDGDGFLAINRWQQSLSHHTVFAAGDIASRADTRHPKNGEHALQAAGKLAANLLATLQGDALRAHVPPARTLTLLGCGDGEAIVNWGNWTAQGAWAWRWKDRIDRRFVRRYGNRQTDGQ